MDKYRNSKYHNKYFNDRNDTLEQDLYESQYIDYLYDHGDVVTYIPRFVFNRDPVLQIDSNVVFTNSFRIPALLPDLGANDNSFTAFAFGLVNSAGSSVEFSRKQFKEFAKNAGLDESIYFEPLAGDLVYVGYGNNTFKNTLYEITKVQPPSTKWAHGKNFAYSIYLKHFMFNNEHFDSGIGEVDSINNQFDNDFNISQAINQASNAEQSKIIDNNPLDPIKHKFDDWDD